MSLPLPMAIPLVSLMFVPALQPPQTSKMYQISVKNATATVVIVAPMTFVAFIVVVDAAATVLIVLLRLSRLV